MKLSDGEKIIMLMLSEIYEKLDIKGEIDSDFIKSAIFSDQLWGLKWKYSGIPFDESENPKIVNEVVDILDMWSFIERAYNQLSPEEKERLETDADPFGKDVKFIGFDGNNEIDHMVTAKFLVNELERFQEFKDHYFNSHSHSLQIHQRMLIEFKKIRNKLVHNPGPLSLDDLTKILKARRKQ